MNIIPMPSRGLNNAAHVEQTLTMSSRQIAELVEKRHDKVKQSIERLVERGTIVPPVLTDEQEIAITPTGGRRTYTASVYLLDERSSYIVVAQLSPEFTARLVDEWKALKERAGSTYAIPQTYEQALEAHLEQVKRNNALQIANQRQAEEIQALEPDAAAHQRFVEAEGSVLISHAAKLIRVPPKSLFRWMSENGWIFRRGGAWVAYSDKLERGFLVMKFEEIRLGSITRLKEQTRVTPAGLSALTKIINASDVFIR